MRASPPGSFRTILAEASGPGTTLSISIEALPAESRAAEGGLGLAGPRVVARVEDQGCGISADHLKTIFEPFFTTKPGGTGLGLYISHDIVKRHAGSLTVTSQPGRGAAFIVELPLEYNGGIA